jgi:hypothetical protein
MYMRQVLCAKCICSTRHPWPMLRQIVEIQSESYVDGVRINYACPVCNHLSRSDVPRRMHAFPLEDGSRHPDDVIDLAVILECEKEGCESPVLLLAPMRSGITPGKVQQHIEEVWGIYGARCAKGFTPKIPFGIRRIEEISWAPELL